ncbi:hypothetical protein [Vibrio anguillarum]|uniref:hypothetical protein n=1 Tax=Vibrio anguillarum TaxID=55601 RepID=UPI000BB4BC74|nr:hypothetical protein [Vibrio anguillarum]ATC60340.1 hypothetical protein CMV05_23405 [Vibrio anguillarum]MBF4249455.1 hypothetical protein [Vibrio anguillarum]
MFDLIFNNLQLDGLNRLAQILSYAFALGLFFVFVSVFSSKLRAYVKLSCAVFVFTLLMLYQNMSYTYQLILARNAAITVVMMDETYGVSESPVISEKETQYIFEMAQRRYNLDSLSDESWQSLVLASNHFFREFYEE